MLHGDFQIHDDKFNALLCQHWRQKNSAKSHFHVLLSVGKIWVRIGVFFFVMPPALLYPSI
ncbi:hypothetical protein B5J92_06880 [Moraxella atlantae]|uniref:Uncharacterized protein n=1 Tax=Faucicola atlantae TaxID=34059 RepID=A0A1B8QLB0_9GAMM|nr:hypothetical protein A9306_02635 [Moraxella atlantae]OPH34779.1 hypothetical protein B5J92_06880 [Moraxella atlantae]